MMPAEDTFIVVKNSIINDVLKPDEGGRFLTVGYQRQRESADLINESRQVTLFYQAGEFKKSAGRAYGEVMHDVTYIVNLAVAPAATVDLSVLNDPDSTASEKATALRQMSEAGVLADAEMDDLIQIVRRILTDARNADMGLPKGTIANVWLSQVQKDAPVPDGEYAILTASMRLTLRVAEQVQGEELPTAADPTLDNTIDIDGDDTEKTGVTIAP